MLISRYPTTSRTQPCAKEAAPACPVCGGLQCLCRPRFFPGQLLTEQDLNRLDRYIRDKNRLHTRYLHGWGVVCGLEVTCDACDDAVRVSAGYALSPCGDDLIVCADDTVDICALIRQCWQKERRDCDPPRRRTDDCDDVEETWVLALCYEEKPSRGITALRTTARTSGACCSRCGGTTSTCGCGCGGHADGNGHAHGHANGHGSGYANGNGSNGGTRTAVRPAPVQCEPTVICEGYRYAVYRAPVQREDDDESGALAERFACCARPYLDFVRELGPILTNNLPAADRTELCCSMKRRLREALLARPVYDCTLLDRLDRIRCTTSTTTITHQWRDAVGESSVILDSVEGFAPGQTATIDIGANAETRVIQSVNAASNTVTFTAPFANDHQPGAPVTVVVSQGSDEALRELVFVWFQALLACICSAMLPPCPAPAEDNCVPLATVTVRRRDCHVLRVCNWTVHRKFATTFPSLQYWLSPLPFGRQLRALIERLCCELTLRFDQRDVRQTDTVSTGITPASTGIFSRSTTAPPANEPTTGGPTGASTGIRGSAAAAFDARRSRALSNLITDALTGRATPLSPEALFQGLMGTAGDEGGLSSRERADPLSYLMAGQFARPLVLGAIPNTLSTSGGLAGVAAVMAASAGEAGRTADRADLDDLREQVTALQQTMEQQRTVIAALNKRLSKDR